MLRVVLSFLLVSHLSLFAKETLEVHFPNVQGRISGSIPSHITLKEIRIWEEFEKRQFPVHLQQLDLQEVSERKTYVLSLEGSSDPKKRKWVFEFVRKFREFLPKHDSLLVHFQNDGGNPGIFEYFPESFESKFMGISKTASRKKMSSGIELLEELESKRDLSIAGIYFVYLTTQFEDLYKLSVLAKKSRKMKLPLNSISFSNVEISKLAEYSGGELFPLSDAKLMSQLWNHIQKNLLYSLEFSYKSQVPNLSRIFSSSVKTHIGILGDREIVLEYSVSPILDFVTESKTVLLSLFFFTVLVAWLLLKLKDFKMSPSPRPAVTHTVSSEERDVYSKVYGTTINPWDDRDGLETEEDLLPSSTYQRTNVRDILSETRNVMAGTEEFGSSSHYLQANLILQSGLKAGEQFTLSKNRTIFGNDEESDFSIPDSSLVGKQFMIQKKGSHWILYDTLSKKGVFLNGKKLLRPRILYDFDEITVSGNTYIFRGR